MKERNEKIYALRKEGKTLQQIADVIGITRERVRQIGHKMEIDNQVPFSEAIFLNNNATKKEKVSKTCPKCSKIFVVVVSSTRKYCSRECFKLGSRKYATPEEAAEAKRRYTIIRYQTDPVFREKVRARYKKWQAEREAKNPELRAKRLAKMKESAKKNDYPSKRIKYNYKRVWCAISKKTGEILEHNKSLVALVQKMNYEDVAYSYTNPETFVTNKDAGRM